MSLRTHLARCATLAGLAVLGTLTTGQPVPKSASQDSRQKSLDEFLEANPAVPGVVATYRSDTAAIDWSGAAGFADLASRTPLTTAHVFKIASVTKLFVSGSVLRLMEQGKIDLNAPISRYISSDTASLLRTGPYDPDGILVRHLLTHTSGLFDYASSEKFAAAVQANPKRRWTRRDQIEFALRNGKPAGEPGEAFAYADTGYILLGEAVEHITGESLSKAIRRLVDFSRLRLQSTVWEDGQDRPEVTAPLFKSYYQETDVSVNDPSFDLYGGGGLLSTTRDIAVFVKAAALGYIFEQARTRTLAFAVPPAKRDPRQSIYANMGTWTMIGGEQCWGHTGFFGTFAFYCPSTGTTYAINFGVGATPVKLKPLLDALKSNSK